METWQAINSLRVVRDFSDRPIDDAHLDRILNAGRRTGSSKNDQTWAFMVIRDRNHLAGYPADPSVLTGPNRAGGRVSLDEVVHEERW